MTVDWFDALTFLDLTTSLGNKFRCRVTENGMLSSGRLGPIVELDDLLSEKEWEVAERYAEKVFFDAGLLKEKVWDTDDINSNLR